MSGNLIDIEDLRVQFDMRAGNVYALNGVSFSISRGETLGLVGESGCGKSVTARAILGIVPKPGKITNGRILFHDGRNGNAPLDPVDLLQYRGKSPAMRAIRGAQISMIFQEPQSSLSPVHRVGDQIIEAIRLHEKVDVETARQRAVHLLQQVGMKQPEMSVNQYSFELSGGMRQRAMIAMALSFRPSLLIADEPTTALDVTIQAQILELLLRLQQDLSMSILLITHNLGVVAGVAHRVAVMYLGKIVEIGTTLQVFKNPKHPYTHGLLRSVPKIGARSENRLWHIEGTVPDSYTRIEGCAFYPRCPHFIKGLCDVADPEIETTEEGHSVQCHLYSRLRSPVDIRTENRTARGESAPAEHSRIDKRLGDPLLSVRGLAKHFGVHEGWLRKPSHVVKAVDGVSFDIYPGETLALVGESGCGKTTTGKCILRAVEPTAGSVLWIRDGQTIDMLSLPKKAMREMRRNIQIIFQDPYASLNPRMTVQQIISEPMVCHKMANPKERLERVSHMMEVVGLDPHYRTRYPHAFSGGQRQRIGIARALILNPQLIVADEPVSALDVSIQAQVINLLIDLQRQFGLAYLFISHDLGVVEYISDRIAVMYMGELVELADTDELFGRPLHPYTRALLSAVPRPDPEYKLQRMVLEGEVATVPEDIVGCLFHPRCRHAVSLCREKAPVMRDVPYGGTGEHLVACHCADYK